MRPYLRAACLAGAVLVSIAGLGAADAIRASTMAGRYQAAARSIHAEAFPDVPVSDMRGNARGRLAGGGVVSFIDLNRRIEMALGDTGEVSIERIQFDAARAAFSFSVRATSNDAIDAFRERLGAGGVDAIDVSGYRRSGADWVGDMAVRL